MDTQALLISIFFHDDANNIPNKTGVGAAYHAYLVKEKRIHISTETLPAVATEGALNNAANNCVPRST